MTNDLSRYGGGTPDRDADRDRDELTTNDGNTEGAR
jgi:hypothetical protein